MRVPTVSNAFLLQAAAAVAVVGVGLYLVSKVAGTAGGILSGNNAVTENATDASGNPVTAYQGAGVVGTLGAATNAASGGILASFGGWLGRTAYDLTHSDPLADLNSVQLHTRTTITGPR